MSNKKTQLPLGNLYDLARQAAASAPVLSDNEIEEDAKVISSLIEKTKHIENYYMLLCKEQSDYTVFNIKGSKAHAAEKVKREVISLLKERGQIVSIEKDSVNQKAVELWIKNKENSYVYYLFPYTKAVIEV